MTDFTADFHPISWSGLKEEFWTDWLCVLGGQYYLGENYSIWLKVRMDMQFMQTYVN